eukprot:TRINITY_DN7811_c0_g1_i1.p1 TRINITY_DN7811_c0_g1~~TRINITY_DN7811_c0_g1_i1.p1  ORF type:complete len:1054 (-),score=219.08 TRINITY_DN7811_c0_g1_i1:70-3231(-)
MERLLNFNDPNFDVTLLENVVQAMMTGSPQEMKAANEVLTALKSHNEAWTRVDVILEKSTSQYAQFFALQILDELIKTRWKILPSDQKEAIKSYIVSLVIKLSDNHELMQRNALVLNRMNVTLVQILKQDWPHGWSDFIPQIISASQTNESICENNMKILTLLSEEVFDFSKGILTARKTEHLKRSLSKEFNSIFQLCDYIMNNSTRPSLLYVTLQCLLKYISWIPLGYIFKTNLIDELVDKYISFPELRNTSIQCLCEVAQLEVDDDAYIEKLVILFKKMMNQVYIIIPPGTNVPESYSTGSEDERNFIQNCALFFSSFFTNHRDKVEESLTRMVLDAHSYMVQFSWVEELELFKICLEYWTEFAEELYSEAPISENSGLFLSSSSTSRRQIYSQVLSQVRTIMVRTMARPEEVIITEDEDGAVVRVYIVDGDVVARYKAMKYTLVLLTHLDSDDMRSIMLNELHTQASMQGQFSRKLLNSICWGIGSISNSQSEEVEQRFLVNVIRDLLGMVDRVRGKDNKAVVASNIMYVVGQYPRFLRAQWKFMSTVVKKLFEFMHETHPGVQTMACDTFLKIASKCSSKFIISSYNAGVGSPEPFINEILGNLPGITQDLDKLDIHTFYQAVGHMIVAEASAPTREVYLEKLMSFPNQLWQEVMFNAQRDISFLNNVEVYRRLINILKTNVKTCESVGDYFLSQIGRIYNDTLNIYQFYSQEIHKSISVKGPQSVGFMEVKYMRSVKREIINLFRSYTSQTEDINNVLNTFLPQLIPIVLEDYKASIPECREKEVLQLLVAVVDCCEEAASPLVPVIFESIFECTLEMITKNFEDFPDHRVEFFNLLQSLIVNCFDSLKKINPEHFRLVIHSIIWAFKHTMRNIAETGLNILLELLQLVHDDDAGVTNTFYQNFFLSLIQDIFCVLTDSLHKTGFSTQARIILEMVRAVDSGKISVPLWEQGTQDPTMTNQRFLREYMMHLLSQAFPNLAQDTVSTFVLGLFDGSKSMEQYKEHLRDFLCEINEFEGGDDNSKLYIDEEENMMKQELEQKLKIPGMSN